MRVTVLHRAMWLATVSIGVGLSVVISGCSQIPAYQAPSTPLPADWNGLNKTELTHIALTPTPLSQASLNEAQWWHALSGDAQLYALIEEARAHNADAQLAKIRLRQANALLQQSQAARLPQLNGTLGLGRTQSSDQAYPQDQGATFGNFSLGALLSYELDVWGKVEAAEQSAQANVNASQADEKAVNLSVSAAVAKAYFNLQALNQNLLLAQQTIQSRTETLDLRQTQLDYGSVTPLTVYQAQSELAAVQIALHQLTEQRNLQWNALGVLVGRTPQALVNTPLDKTLQTQNAQTFAMPSIPVGLPSELLQRRPDIIAAEQRLMAANANIGVARASLYPSISLTGFLGLKSESLSHVFDSNAGAWNASADVSAPIFDGGQRQAQVALTQAQQQAQLVQYQQTVRNAFKEVLDALVQIEGAQQQLAAQQRQVEALKQTLVLAQTRFDGGYSSYLEVLDAQRSMFSAELTWVTMRLNDTAARVNLYKALGGSWL
ncbi:efflux transporter outer membrane subunit [Thiomicrorhabdus aquaedulcis]|uniref:efflux transporter outer membrane subunit n=1 Tax=Thiomicrorhabdus aquaedulcis TaxID=2211106 RepID=UPI000FD95D15|nr:efflux transporter outer membrane subunit [Thiomicrorhabdus aquaedulcis]